MSQDPRRLLDGGTDDPALREALEAGRSELPSTARLAAIGAATAAALHAAPTAAAAAAQAATATATASSAAGAAAGTAAGLSGAAKLVAVALVGSAVAGGGWVAYRASHVDVEEPQPPARIELPAPAPPAPAVEAVAEEPPSPAPEPVAPPVAERPPRTSARPPDAAAEVALLQKAQDALAASPRRALALCDAHARRFKAGQLEQEREVIAVQALIALGRQRDAEARAERFRQEHPRSTHLRRIEQLLGK